MRKILFYLTFLISFGLYAQETEQSQEVENVDLLEEKVKHFSAGVKVGVPNIVGLSFEGVTPLLDNRLAAFADFSGFNIPRDDIEIGLEYSEFGVNAYFGSKGKGFYAGLGSGKLSTDLTFFGDLDGDVRGKGTTNLSIKSTNLKVGIKTGERIYFRFEVGYGIFRDISYPDGQGEIVSSSDIPDQIPVKLREIEGNQTETVFFQVPNIPGIGSNGIIVGNFGFGLSF